MDMPVTFKRMVLGLPHSAIDYGSVTFAAELADLLGLDLIGIFAEDDRLMDLAVLPCVREFRLSGDGWHRLDAAQLERSSNQMAAEARRLFGDAVKALRIGTRFDLLKGQIAEAIGSQSMADDILAVIMPRNPAERVTYQFRQLLNAALSRPGATLVVPSRISRRRGPIVVIAGNEHDTSAEVGLRLARAAQERLIVLTPAGANEPMPAPPIAGMAAVDWRSTRSSQIGLPELSSLLALTAERLVVLSRAVDVNLASQLASERGVPVLLTGRRA